MLLTSGTASLAVNVAPRVDVPCPASIDLTGSTECSTALNSFLATLAPGSSVDFAGGTVWCEQTVGLTGKSGVSLSNLTVVAKTGNPNGQSYSTRRHWLFTGCTDLVLENLRVDGPNTIQDPAHPGYAVYDATKEGEAAFAFTGCTGMAVRNCSASHVFGDGIMVWLTPSIYVTVEDFAVSWNGRQGISVSSGSHVVMRRITIANSRRSGIDLEPDSSGQSVTDVWLDQVTAKTWLIPLASAGRGNVSRVVASNWSIDTNSVPVVSVGASDGTRRADWTVTGWRQPAGGLGSPQPALRFTNVDRVTVRDVQLNVASSQSRTAVGFTGCGGACTVADSTWSGANHISVATPQPDFALTNENNTPALAVT